MSDLIRRIQQAQRNAGEAAVIADLEARGLVKPTGLVPIEEHNRLTTGPAPWTATRISEELFQLALSVFGSSSEDDDKRVYRTLQAYEWKRS
jgi:hypothetical protein